MFEAHMVIEKFSDGVKNTFTVKCHFRPGEGDKRFGGFTLPIGARNTYFEAEQLANHFKTTMFLSPITLDADEDSNEE